jgi:hypothetical protein
VELFIKMDKKLVVAEAKSVLLHQKLSERMGDWKKL